METNSQNTFWNGYAQKYDAFIKRHAKDAYKQSFRLIAESLGKEHSVLEIGTATGLIALSISPLVKEIVATDFATEMIEHAQEKYNQSAAENITFMVCDATKLPFENQQFDRVIASNVFHLIPNPHKAMEEIGRVLKTDGKAIIPTYCHGQNLKTQLLSRLMGISGFRAISRWSTATYRKFMEDCGFTIEIEHHIKDKMPLAFVVVSKNA